MKFLLALALLVSSGGGSVAPSGAGTGSAGLLSAAMYAQLHTTDNIDAAVTATGSDQAGAYAITKPYTYVTGGSQATPNGVRLPTIATANVPHWVCNLISAPVQVTVTGIAVYPSSGETIIPNAVNVRDILYAGQCNIYLPVGTTSWRALVPFVKGDHVGHQFSGTTAWFQNPSFYAGVTLASASSGVNLITIPDNQAIAAKFDQGGTAYLSFATTDGAELVTHNKPIKPLIATPVAAAGTTIANCGQIVAGTVALQVTGADGTKGACLPTTSSVTTCVRVMNPSTSVLKVYGADADTSPTVNGGAGDAAYSQIAGSSLLYCNSGVAWTSY